MRLCRAVFVLVATLALVARSAIADDSAQTPDVCQNIHVDDSSPRDLIARSACEERMGRLVAAWKDALAAQRLAASKHAARSLREARGRLAQLASRIPKLTLEQPEDGELEAVSLDGAALPVDSFDQPLPVDPGRHVVKARGTVDGRRASFKRTFGASEREDIAIRIVLASAPEPDSDPPPASPLPPSNRDVAPAGGSSLVIAAALETGGYSDSNHINVFSPSIRGDVSSPTAGWTVGAGYVVDLVSAASPDIVSEASPPFHEVRHAGTITGGYKPGLFGVQASADVSSEPDYLSMGVGANFSADLDDKLVTPTFAAHYSHDTIGRSTTPFSVFHHTLDTTEVDLGVTLVISRRSLIHLGGTMEIELGDQSKPYRYVPLFDPAIASRVTPGQSIASVNLARESLRPLEQLPLDRERYAVGARFLARLGSATLRVEERLYADSWQQYATTSDVRLVVDVGSRVRLSPHGRVNVQTGTSFYKLAYSAVVDPAANRLAVPIYRTDDRELGPSLGATGGGGVRVLLTEPGAANAVALSLQVDALYTRYFQSLFETSRTALYGTLGLDVELE